MIEAYRDFLSEELLSHLTKTAKPFPGVPGLTQVGESGGLETPVAMSFLVELFKYIKPELHQVLLQRKKDRDFIDSRTKALVQFNQQYEIDYRSPFYKTVYGLCDGEGRVVLGPLQEGYAQTGGKPIAPIPENFKTFHLTLFGPPDNAKLSINAMNAFHRKLPEEPQIITELVEGSSLVPMWGADDEDSKTPLRQDLIEAGVNLSGCLEKTLKVGEKKVYELASEKLAQPIKRFPGLALPCTFLFFNNEPLPLHLYDFVMHFVRHWDHPERLAFYVPKLENEEEARYVKNFLHQAELMMKALHPEYQMGRIRLMIVLENPRAVFRAHEIMDELYPYFMGASLGWHDFLASTARVFKEDPNYRIPVKADPDIVIKYIKASHELLADVVGPRGGIKVGGMYGILPLSNDVTDPSFQVAMKGYIRDVITQLKRNLSGFWVAHPDFVRIGVALVESWKKYQAGDQRPLQKCIDALLPSSWAQEVWAFIQNPDIESLDKNHPLYGRALIVADLTESSYIANNHPDEIRYNIFQTLQYLTDWLCGHGCVALPTSVGGVSVRVMDDLATAERSRWEVWHELYHQRFSVEDFLRIAFEEYTAIRKNLETPKRQIQIRWDDQTSKWYPVALKLMIKLMTDQKPVEFATELMLPFTVPEVRNAEDPWKKVQTLTPHKYEIHSYVERFIYHFERCGAQNFAQKMAQGLIVDEKLAQKLISDFSKQEIQEAAFFHGDIGERAKTLDVMAQQEQARAHEAGERVLSELRTKGEEYKQKFGFKFLVSAKGKSAEEMLALLQERINRTPQEEERAAKEALWEITQKRYAAEPLNALYDQIQSLKEKYHIQDAQLSLVENKREQHLCFGEVSTNTLFEIASLSKTFASCFALHYFAQKKISLDSKVNDLLRSCNASYQLPDGDDVTIKQLMNHTALNMHYVNGIPLDHESPCAQDFLRGNPQYGYVPLKVLDAKGTKFHYSGGGFILLEYLIEQMEKKPIQEITQPFFLSLGLTHFTFDHKNQEKKTYAQGFKDSGEKIEGGRLMFPSFAAGALSSAKDVLTFLQFLEHSYHDVNSAPLNHEVVVEMLHGEDKGSKEFMQALMGLGVFILEAGTNKILLHQGANDGFRCLFLHCYAGPDRGKGMVILCNGEENGVLFIAEVAQVLLQYLNFSGIDFNRFSSEFQSQGVEKEQLVNKGYKELIFNAFEPLLPEKIIRRGPLFSWHKSQLLDEAQLLQVTNQTFARAENLISLHQPVFEADLFGDQGKIMDSWETVRHNPLDADECVWLLKKPSPIKYIYLSTEYHFGNHVPLVELWGLQEKEWHLLLPKSSLQGHSEHWFSLPKETPPLEQIKVRIFPDGGLTRLALFDETLPAEEKKAFEDAPVIKASAKIIPQTHKPLSLTWKSSKEELQMLHSKQYQDVASLVHGARILRASNEHYSPASQMLSPFPPLHMFDGLESARSREKNHHEEVEVGFDGVKNIKRIVMDFTYFVNNNPKEVEVWAWKKSEWQQIIPRTSVKAFRGNQRQWVLANKESTDKIKVCVYPDGGLNRLHVYSE